MQDNGHAGVGKVKVGLAEALTFHASFDHGPDADFARGDGRIYSVMVADGKETGSWCRDSASPPSALPTRKAGSGRRSSSRRITVTSWSSRRVRTSLTPNRTSAGRRRSG